MKLKIGKKGRTARLNSKFIGFYKKNVIHKLLPTCNIALNFSQQLLYTNLSTKCTLMIFLKHEYVNVCVFFREQVVVLQC